MPWDGQRLYHVPVHPLAERVLGHVRQHELLRAGDRVGAAVSGGIDSVALLRLLLELRGELGIVLSVVHFNHKLRGAASDADEQFVAALAHQHDLEFCPDSADVAVHAREEGVSVEAAARELRYGFFRHLLGSEEEKAPLLPKPGRSGAPQDERPGLKPVIPKNAPGRGPFGSLSSLRAGSKGPLFHGDDKSLSQTAHAVPCGPSLTLDKIATGHTLDDQAETVLMRMIRGAGMRGLGGIYPRIPLEDVDGEVCGEIVRPLLAFRRRELLHYLKDIGQTWREDSTNTDEALTRNRVRKLVLPLLEKEFNPAVAESLAELAEIARGEEDHWENEIAGWMGTTVHWTEPEWAREAAFGTDLVRIKTQTQNQEGRLALSATQRAPVRRASLAQDRLGGAGAPSGPFGKLRASSSQDKEPLAQDDRKSTVRSRIANAPWLVMNAAVSRLWFLGEPAAVQRRLVKAIGEQAGIPLEFRHVEEVLRFAVEDGTSGRELSLPLGWKVRREPDEIAFLTPDLREPVAPLGYEYELPIPGKITVNETGSQIEAQCVPAQAKAGYNFDQLLDAASVPGPLRVRNWRPGDRFWPAHTKSPKKIKELLQERHVLQAERGLWPVIVSGKEIVWVRGFRLPAKLRAKPGREAILILEKPLAAAPAT